jgi:hypothetical protein
MAWCLAKHRDNFTFTFTLLYGTLKNSDINESVWVCLLLAFIYFVDSFIDPVFCPGGKEQFRHEYLQVQNLTFCFISGRQRAPNAAVLIELFVAFLRKMT